MTLQPGRTNLYLGSIIVAWIEWFPNEGTSEIHFERWDGLKSNLLGGNQADCVNYVKAMLPPLVRSLLVAIYRVGSERTWGDAHKV